MFAERVLEQGKYCSLFIKYTNSSFCCCVDCGKNSLWPPFHCINRMIVFSLTYKWLNQSLTKKSVGGKSMVFQAQRILQTFWKQISIPNPVSQILTICIWTEIHRERTNHMLCFIGSLSHKHSGPHFWPELMCWTLGTCISSFTSHRPH